MADESKYGQQKLQVQFELAEGCLSTFSDHQSIVSTETEVIVTFYQTVHPAFSTPEELSHMEKVRAVSVARIVLTPKKAEEFAAVLNTHVEKRRAGSTPDANRADSK
jgi:hypothetical protein